MKAHIRNRFLLSVKTCPSQKRKCQFLSKCKNGFSGRRGVPFIDREMVEDPLIFPQNGFFRLIESPGDGREKDITGKRLLDVRGINFPAGRVRSGQGKNLLSSDDKDFMDSEKI